MKQKKYITWGDILKSIQWLSDKIENLGYRNIYGIPTGGSFIAGLLLQYNPALTIIKEKPSAKQVGKVLIIDDLIDSGSTLKPFLKDKFDCLVLYGKVHSPFEKLRHVPRIIYKSDEWLVFPWDKQEDSGPRDAVLRMIEFIGDDPNREGLKETPDRVIRAYDEIFAGYNQKPKEVFKTFNEGEHDQIIICKDIEFYSMCEHHILPFVGKAHIAYIPGENGRIIGLSKLARLMDIFSKRLQIQERIGDQVTSALMEHLKPLGAACIIEAQHFCMCMRGVKKQNSRMVTSSMKGAFMENASARAELNNLLLL